MSRTSATEPPASQPAMDMHNPHYAMGRHVEIAAWTDAYRAAPEAIRNSAGLAVEQMGDASLLCAPGIDHPMLNRAWVSKPTTNQLREIAKRYAELGVARFMIHVEKRADAPVFPENAGLTRYHRDWVKLLGQIGNRELPSISSELEIREAWPAEAQACGALFCAGFGVPDKARPIFAALVGRPSWRVFVAHDGDNEVVAAGYLFLGDRIAYLSGATTAEAHRRRGAQGALLAARVRAAFGAGCHFIASETGGPVAGDPQHSQRNMERVGLEVVGVTENLVPSGFEWNPGQSH